MKAPLLKLGTAVRLAVLYGAGGEPLRTGRPAGVHSPPRAPPHRRADPGHGGKNKGCLGVDGTYEKVATLDIALRVQRILTEETDAVALLTRQDDRFLGLRERTRAANKWGADVFLSIHLNADAYGAGKGVETWFLSPDSADEEARRLVEKEEAAYGEHDHEDTVQDDLVSSVIQDAIHRNAQAASEVLAGAIVNRLHSATNAPFRGVKQAPFGVLKEANMPAVVVECGFFSHHEEGVKLVDPHYSERIARGIVDGLLEYDRQIGGKRTAHLH